MKVYDTPCHYEWHLLTSKVATVTDMTLKSILLTSSVFASLFYLRKKRKKTWEISPNCKDWDEKIVLSLKVKSDKEKHAMEQALIKKSTHVPTFGFDITCVIFFAVVVSSEKQKREKRKKNFSVRCFPVVSVPVQSSFLSKVLELFKFEMKANFKSSPRWKLWFDKIFGLFISVF